MTAYENSVTILGDVVSAPETFDRPGGGVPIVNLRVKTVREAKDREGNMKSFDTFHQISIYGAQIAERVLEDVFVGDRVFARGSLVYKTIRKDGFEKSYAEIAVNGWGDNCGLAGLTEDGEENGE